MWCVMTLLLLLLLLLEMRAQSCDLCAVSSANGARGESGAGFLLTIAEQFIPYRTELLNGRPYDRSSLKQTESDYFDP